MQAIQLVSHDGIEGMRIAGVPPPTPGPGEVLLDVKAAGVNPVDWKIAQGFARKWLGHNLPITLGADVAGVVSEVGADVDGFRAGDAVYGLISFVRLGTWAGQCIALPQELAKKPQNLSYEAAAAMPLVTLTSWQVLFEAADIQAGQHVLIHAAAGGVGGLAVQLAKGHGCRVTGTASGRNAAYVRGIGADDFVDYTTTDFEDAVHAVDVVYDCVGGDTLRRSYGVLKKGGILVSIADTPSPETANSHGVRATFVAVHPDGRQLTEITRLAEMGLLKPDVSQVYPLSGVADACRQSQSGHTRGKLVLVP